RRARSCQSSIAGQSSSPRLEVDLPAIVRIPAPTARSPDLRSAVQKAGEPPRRDSSERIHQGAPDATLGSERDRINDKAAPGSELVERAELAPIASHCFP